jgi:hypothetical protein
MHSAHPLPLGFEARLTPLRFFFILISLWTSKVQQRRVSTTCSCRPRLKVVSPSKAFGKRGTRPDSHSHVSIICNRARSGVVNLLEDARLELSHSVRRKKSAVFEVPKFVAGRRQRRAIRTISVTSCMSRPHSYPTYVGSTHM